MSMAVSNSIGSLHVVVDMTACMGLYLKSFLNACKQVVMTALNVISEALSKLQIVQHLLKGFYAFFCCCCCLPCIFFKVIHFH